MKFVFSILSVILTCFLLKTARSADADSKPAPDRSVQLTGTFHASPKWFARLAVFPAGTTKFVDLEVPKALGGIPDGTPVRVRGIFRTTVIGPTKNNPSPFPTQWGIFLEVSEIEKFATVEDAFKEARDRHWNQRDPSEP